MKIKTLLVVCMALTIAFSCVKRNSPITGESMRQITDGKGRDVSVPQRIDRIICSGPGCLRYITYMECQDKVIASDDIESRRQVYDARPYAAAHPSFGELPVFGEFRGNDNPELIAALDPPPDIIFKTYAEQGFDPDELQEKTGIPVVCLEYGDLTADRKAFYETLRLIGGIMGKTSRAETVIDFFETAIADLGARTLDIEVTKTCYIGGVSYRGPLGIRSTEPGYPPFAFINTQNASFDDKTAAMAHIDVSKEKIVEWDPDIIFIDCATLQAGAEANALYELKTDPAFSDLTAPKTGNVYGVLPYNSYTQNHGSTLANAYYIGTVLYPGRFDDIDPAKKADDIYSFLVGGRVFGALAEDFGNMVFRRLE